MSDAVVLTVNLLKCQLLGLTDEAEDQAPGYQVQSCVEADCVALVGLHYDQVIQC